MFNLNMLIIITAEITSRLLELVWWRFIDCLLISCEGGPLNLGFCIGFLLNLTDIKVAHIIVTFI